MLEKVSGTYKNVPLTRFTWIPLTYTCNVNFDLTFNLMRIPQQSSIASYSGFCNCQRIPQNLSGIRKICKRNPQTVKEFRNLLFIELAHALAEFKSKDLTIVSGIQEKILKHWLTKSMDVKLWYLQAVLLS